MSDQELQFFQDEDTICSSMHHLSTASLHHHRHPSATSSDSPEMYTTATKRQSSLSPSSFQEPLSKRATLHSPPSPSTTGDDCHFFGFSRLPTPTPFSRSSSASPPPHRLRAHTLPDDINPSAPPRQSSEFPNSPNPVLLRRLRESPNRNIAPQDSLPSPNAAPPLIHRTVSDPNPVVNCQVVASPPPRPRPPLARNASRSPSCGERESPSTKRLRRMKERLREMSQWWNQVVREGDQEDDEPENYSTDNNIHKEESENEIENPSQESVWVEKNGECLVLHFKCPCGTGYQILLCGNNCYYKLTNF